MMIPIMHRLLCFLLPALVVAKLLHSLPEDTHAFPKYKVSFLSHLPLANTTAEKWLSAGLEGAEREFLDQPFVPRKAIESGEDARLSPDTSYALEHMRMGPTDSYLCFIPKPLDPPLSSPPEEDPVDVSPEHSYSLLAPLAGHCLYHRQGWFTYSYCHGSEIRQFKERTNPPPTAGKSQYAGYKPEEDPKWESYTLGRAPQTNTDVAIRNGNIQLAHGGAGGSHYLVQTWGDGTMCDKSGRPREVQIQFHCSMTTSDNILFIKESKTCSYVLVINTPRLCSEPGFKTKRDATEQAYIQCRPVVDDVDAAKAAVQDPSYYDFPSKFTRPQVHLPAPPKAKAVKETHPNDEYDSEIEAALKELFGYDIDISQVASRNVDGGKLVMTPEGAIFVGLEFAEDQEEWDAGTGQVVETDKGDIRINWEGAEGGRPLDDILGMDTTGWGNDELLDKLAEAYEAQINAEREAQEEA